MPPVILSVCTCRSLIALVGSEREAVPGRRTLTFDSAVGASAGARTTSEGEASSMALKTKTTTYTSMYKDQSGNTFEVTRDRYGVAVVRMVKIHR